MNLNKPVLLSKHQTHAPNSLYVDTTKELLICHCDDGIQQHKIENGHAAIKIAGLNILALLDQPHAHSITPSPQTLVISGQGLLNNEWMDGPLIYFNKHSFVEAFVPCGTGFETLITSNSHHSQLNYAATKEFSVQDLLSSAQSCIQKQCETTITCMLSTPTKTELLHLLLAVRALGPSRVKYSTSRPSPQIKRLCENLGIDVQTSTSSQQTLNLAGYSRGMTGLQFLDTDKSLAYLNGLTGILDSFDWN